MRRDAFTLVELLLAVALGAVAALILASLLHTLVQGDRAQSRLLQGPVAARSALLRMARETSCAFAPPDREITPLTLSRSTGWEEPELRLEFYLPVSPHAPFLPGFYGVERVTYEVRPLPGPDAGRELLRLSSPCAGPRTNDVQKSVLLRGPFQLAVLVPDGGNPDAPMAEVWPPEGNAASGDDASGEATPSQPPLPASLRFFLRLPGEPPVETEALVHCAHPLEAPDSRSGALANGEP